MIKFRILFFIIINLAFLNAQNNGLGTLDLNFTSGIQADNSHFAFDYGLESISLLTPAIEVTSLLHQVIREDRVGFQSAAAGYLSTNLLALGLKYLVDRPRPPREYQPRLWNTRITPSFPSGHTASSAAWATAMAYYHPEYRWPLATYIFLSGYSQVYVGNHYLGDVLGGLVLGSLTTLAVCHYLPQNTNKTGTPPAVVRFRLSYQL